MFGCVHAGVSQNGFSLVLDALVRFLSVLDVDVCGWW